MYALVLVTAGRTKNITTITIIIGIVATRRSDISLLTIVRSSERWKAPHCASGFVGVRARDRRELGKRSAAQCASSLLYNDFVRRRLLPPLSSPRPPPPLLPPCPLLPPAINKIRRGLCTQEPKHPGTRAPRGTFLPTFWPTFFAGFFASFVRPAGQPAGQPAGHFSGHFSGQPAIPLAGHVL